MRFEWDASKNRANVRKHGFDFADAVESCWFGLTSGKNMGRSAGLESAQLTGGQQ